MLQHFSPTNQLKDKTSLRHANSRHQTVSANLREAFHGFVNSHENRDAVK
jgi:hypothetical protein